MATQMKISNIIFCAVVLWTVVESRHVRRMERSLTIEGKGRNLTEKLQQEEIHADGLQHFTFPQTSTQTTPSASFREDPLILEDGNVQTLKNDDNIRILYDRKVTIDKESPIGDFPDEKNTTGKTKANDVIVLRYNQTGHSSNKRSEMLISHSYYEHSTPTVYDEEERDEKERDESYSQEHHPVVSFTESLKDDLEWKNVETKKKEKGKKEILEVVTVPTDHFKLEKPLKDNVIGGKLKEKNKDSISEALDEQRSTIRIRNSSSVRLSENDNNTLGSLDIFKTDSSIANNEESVGQSVNSVINSNGVNSEYAKRSRVKYSAAKRAHDIANDTDAENSSASENQLVEEAARNTVPVPLNVEPQTTPPILIGTTGNDDKLKLIPSYQRPKPTDSTPTKIDIFEKLASPLPTALVKPSVAFKQQLASKLKGLDPAPTVPITGSDDIVDENFEKLSGKLPTKPSLKKKSKPDYYAQPSEMYIPPTATAWTLVSMKAAAEDLRTARKPVIPLDVNSSIPDTTVKTTVQQTTTIPVTRVKSFVPWSTRLLKSTTSMKPPTAPLSADENRSEPSTVSLSEVTSSNKKEKINKVSSTSLENLTIPSTTEDHTVIRSTKELDRNMTETSINLIQASMNDIMIRDQSSTTSHDIMTTERSTTESVITTSSTPKKEITLSNSSVVTSDNQAAEKENTIDSKPEVQINAEEKVNVKIEKKNHSLENIEKKRTVNNEIATSESTYNASDTKTKNINENYNFVLTTSSTTSTPEGAYSSKIKNPNEFGDLDPLLSDIFGDGVDESKSLEDDEEEEKQKQTTALPVFDPFETTIMTDLDEEDEVDERYEEELAILPDKPTINHTKTETLAQSNITESTTEITTIPNTTIPSITTPNTSDSSTVKTSPLTQTITEIPVKPNTSVVTEPPVKPTSTQVSTEMSTKVNTTPLTTNLEFTSSTPSLQMPEINSTGIYVTSFDIVSKENTTLVVTKTPTEGDINWYNVDTKPVNIPVEETSNKTNPVDTTFTAPVEPTNEPETTTETSKHQTTYIPETTISVISVFKPTITIRTNPPFHEEKEVEEGKEDVSEEGEIDKRACVVELVSAWKFYHERQQLQQSIAARTNDISWEQVRITSRKIQDCQMEYQSNDGICIDVCFVDENQEPSPPLKEQFLSKRLRDSSFNVMNPTSEGFDNVFAAIVLSVIAAICLVLLGILLIIVRKRQGRFNYGQRCTPVSLDDYSLDNISVYNSVQRRKGYRASKRSYGNPAFDDPGAPTHSINFAGLANFSSDREALDEEFRQIPMITVKPDELPPGAESKNRYANVIPLPETRVPLQIKEGADPLDEYINANYIKGPKGQEKLYIACQAPLQSTVEDFWRMVWQQQTKVILMLTALTENGVEKCADYLPQLEITDCHRVFGDFQITLKNHEVRNKYVISILQLKNLESNLWREVTHLWYSNWPAQGVPEDGNALIAFLIEARSYARSGAGPTVVHCSPGTGRTGTMIAIDLCIRDFETIRTVDIPRTVYALRRDRAGSVQTKDQYAFIYQVLNLYATKLTGGGMDSI